MIRSLTTDDTQQIAQLHARGLADDFLPQFGVRFLQVLHTKLLHLPQVIGYGYFENDILVGFIIGTTNTSISISQALRHGLLQLAPLIVGRLITHPHIIKNIWQSTRYGQQQSHPKAELLIIVITPHFQRKGIGKKLVSQLRNAFRRQNIKMFRVGTTSDNQISNAFYIRLGGHLEQTKNLNGKRWNLYLLKS